MMDQLKQIHESMAAFVAHSQEDLATFRQQFLGKKSVLSKLQKALQEAPPTERKEMGKLLNSFKKAAQEKFNTLVEQLKVNHHPVHTAYKEDFTLPPPAHSLGGLHPLTIVSSKIVALFERIGFNLSEGPEIENDWHNFTALNFPPDHPARDMQDTFFIEKGLALRTHTSSVQVRVMETQTPPIRTISPGRVFRNEAISARAHCIFHQIEGLYINRNVSFVDLKETILHFVKAMFGANTRLRFRPSYFPFTEPSAEVDIDCRICSGEGCKVCKHTGWVEIMGAGMVDPQVLINCKIDPEVYTGFAFGMGIERIAMLLYRISDLRLFTENDLRFLRQFVSH